MPLVTDSGEVRSKMRAMIAKDAQLEIFFLRLTPESRTFVLGMMECAYLNGITDGTSDYTNEIQSIIRKS